MPAGLQVFFGDESDKAGKIQIDDSYINFHLRKSGVVRPQDWTLFIEPGSSGSGGRTKYFNIDVSNFNEPMIVLNPLGDYKTSCAVTYGQSSDSSKKYIILNIWNNYEPDKNVEYFIFDNYSPPTENFGLEIKNEAGKTVYHSSWYRMRVVASQFLNQPAKIGDVFNLSIPASAKGFGKLGLMLPNSRVSMLDLIKDSNSYAEVFKDSVYFKDKNTISVYQLPVKASNGWWDPFSGFWNQAPLIILYIDLSNYPLNFSA